MEFIAFVIGLIFAVVWRKMFGGNVLTFIVTWAAGIFIAYILLVITGIVLSLLFSALLVFVVMALVFSVTKYFRARRDS
ncbi:hypothetical protein [Heyndrickxia acidiproducens]|uniref:hypothetical protein n=1 Tax=Heyndrickxia acidiproducens TaxID=1121084 RepID=UPI00037C1063|nr:hypothetical protein [Heyndrickxia acidiproducens]